MIQPSVAIVASLLACAIPGTLFALLFYHADRYEREPIHFLVLVFLWGTVPSVLLSELLNPQLISPLAWLSRDTVNTLVAPAVEEFLKALAIAAVFVLARQEFDGVLDGMVYGAMVGLGFATAENYIYYLDALQSGGWYALFELFVLRGLVFGISHAMYSGLVGAGFGMARHALGFWKAAGYITGGLLGAYALHALHNYGGRSPGVGTALSILIAALGLLVWYLGFQLAYRQERDILTNELRDEIGAVLSEREYAHVTGSPGRPAMLDDRAQPGRAARLRLTIELANRKHRARTIGVPLEPELPTEIAQLRAQISALQTGAAEGNEQ
jgi:RsiW-degrading membrane proteinase PrsW (M82 family)